MELRELRTFVLTTQVGSFSKVAQILYTTQPSVSKQISALENELGKPLFVRDSHSLELTDFGQSFLPYAEEIVQAEINAMTFLTVQDTKPSVFLTIGVATSCGTVPNSSLAEELTQAIEHYRQHRPEVSVSIDFADDRDLLKMIRTGKYDLALCPVAGYGENAAASNALARRTLRDYHNCLVWAPKLGSAKELDSLIQNAQAISFINDLASLDLVSLLIADRAHPLQHRIIHNWFGLLSELLSGGSIGIIPGTLAPLAHSCGLETMPLDRDVYRTDLCLYQSANPDHDKYIQELSDALCMGTGGPPV